MKIRPLVLAAAAASLLAAAPTASAAEYVPGQVLVAPQATTSAASSHSAKVVHTRRGESVRAAAKRLAKSHGYAVPNYIAHASGFIPNDTGIGGPTQWQDLQWNFTGPFGVN